MLHAGACCRHLDFRSAEGYTPLHIAAMLGKHRVLRHILDLGVSPDLRDTKGMTPLYLACTHGGCVPRLPRVASLAAPCALARTVLAAAAAAAAFAAQ